MTDSKPNLVVRHGGIEDRLAVLDIDKDVYGGQDYLAAAYGIYCQDPYRINYILEADGLAVAYFCTTIVDEGNGVFLQAARTRPGYRQRGYQNYLKKAAAEDLKKHYQKLQEMLFGAYSDTPNTTLFYKISGDRRIIHAKPFFYFLLTQRDELLDISKSLQDKKDYVDGVQKIEFNKLTEYVSRDDFRRHFPTDRVLVNYVPYKLDVLSNFSLLHRFPKFFQLSYDDKDQIDGVSFYCVYLDKERDWERHELEIYCNTREACLKHFVFFLKEVTENVKYRNAHCTALVPLHLYNTGISEDILRETFSVPITKPFGDEVTYVPLVCDTGYFNNVS